MTTGIQFPDHSMSGIALRYANIMAQRFESPKLFWYFSFMTCLSSLVADKVILDGALKTQLRLYTIMLGSSGLSHKSWAGEYTYKFFHSLFGDLFPVCTGANSAEGLINVLKREKRVLFWLDELQHFIKKASISGSVLLQVVNTLYESNREQIEKSQESINIDDAYLSLMAASTMETYEKIFTPEFQAIGFPARLFIVPAERNHKVSRPRNIPDDEINPIRDKLLQLYDRCKDGKVITMTIKADRLYDEWYHDLPDSEYVNRLDGYALRLMALHALSDGRDEVHDEIVERVASICDWQLKVRKQYAPYDADNQLAELEQKIMRHCAIYTPTERELKVAIRVQKYGYGLYGKAIDNLVRHSMLEKVEDGRTQRLSVIE